MQETYRLSDPSAVKSLLARHGFTFSKSLGQNFLINPSVCPRMAEECGAGPGTGVLEVGPGIGVLTVELAKRAEKVVSIELDKRLLPVLHETLGNHPNAKVVNDDVLKVDLQRLLQEEFAGMDVVVCANLPYYITSPVIMRLLEERLPIRALTVMVQKEAAQRLCAPPGTRACGAVSVAVQYYAEPRVLFQVSRGSFLPPPNVDSTVIRLDVREQPPIYVPDEGGQHRFWGFSILVINWEKFLNEIELERLEAASYHYQIWKKDLETGEKIVIAQCTTPAQGDTYQVPCAVPNDTWYFEIRPATGWITPTQETFNVLLLLVLPALLILTAPLIRKTTYHWLSKEKETKTV